MLVRGSQSCKSSSGRALSPSPMTPTSKPRTCLFPLPVSPWAELMRDRPQPQVSADTAGHTASSSRPVHTIEPGLHIHAPLLRPKTLKCEYPGPSPEVTKANEDFHFLEDVTSVIDKTHDFSPDSALSISESDDPVINDNDLGSAVIKIKYNLISSTTNSMVSNPKHTDHVSSHQMDPTCSVSEPSTEIIKYNEDRGIIARPPLSHMRTHSTNPTSREGQILPSRPSLTTRQSPRTTLVPRPLVATNMSPPT